MSASSAGALKASLGASASSIPVVVAGVMLMKLATEL